MRMKQVKARAAMRRRDRATIGEDAAAMGRHKISMRALDLAFPMRYNSARRALALTGHFLTDACD